MSQEESRFAVDVVIAVHSPERPVARAITSVLDAGVRVGAADGARITVVCHNIGVDTIRERVPPAARELVRFLPLVDHIPSAAGPFNAGLDAATASFVSIMGSDDTLEAGSLAQWLEQAERTGAAAVIAPQRHASGRKIHTPPVRPFRRSNLDPVKDRLTYRTAPLGLIRTAEVKRLGLRFTAGLRTGEDQEFSARLWFGGGRIEYARGAGRYVVGSDASDRVTFSRRPVRDELEFVVRLVSSDWFRGLRERERRAIAIKLLRVHVFGLVLVRQASGGWSDADRAELAAVVRRLLDTAAGVEQPLAEADRRLIDAILDETVDAEVLVARAHGRRRFATPATLVTRRPSAVLHREAPPRFVAASLLC